MTDDRSTESLWAASSPGATSPSEPELPPSVDVAIAGAGITGLVHAVELARRGVGVAVLDVRDVAAGTTGRSSAKVAVLHGTQLGDIAAAHGDVAARAYLAGNRHGLDWIREEVRTREIECGWEERTAVNFASDDGIGSLRRDRETWRRLGVEVGDDALDLPFDVAETTQLPGQAQFDPVAFCRALAAEIHELGGVVLPGVRVLGVDTRADGVDVLTDRGRLPAGWLVSATGLPSQDRGLHFARVEPMTSYVVVVEPERLPPPGMYLGTDSPTRSLRTADLDGTTVLLVGGENHKTGQGGSNRARYRTLVAWADTHFGVRRVTHRFLAEDFTSADHLPFAGPLPFGGDRILVATGYSKWGFTNAVAAAAVNVSHITDGDAPAWAGTFRSTRTGLAGAKELLSANANVAGAMVRGWLGTVLPKSAPATGEGRVTTRGLDRVAVSRDDRGQACAVSGVCPHLGGIVEWNDADGSWDCPLHGSRFGRDGALVHGPAVNDLRSKD